MGGGKGIGPDARPGKGGGGMGRLLGIVPGNGGGGGPEISLKNR